VTDLGAAPGELGLDEDPWNPLSDISLGVLLDNARESVMAQRRAGREPDVIVVSPEVHDALRYVKRHEIRRGIDLMLLGKRLRVDGNLRREDVTTAETKPEGAVK